MNTVYLAGPITGLTYAQCTDWREKFAAQLRPGIRALSPMRGKHYLEDAGPLGSHYLEHAMSTGPAIVGRDRMDCSGAAVVLVNLLGAERISIGTVMEVAWADAARRPVLLVMEQEGNAHDHSMLTHCVTWRVETLDEAATILNATLEAYL